MDVWLPAVAAVAGAIAVAAIVWLRKRQIERAQRAMREAHSAIQKIQADLQPHLIADDYIPEALRRPLDAQVRQLTERSLPKVAKVLRGVRDPVTREELESVLRDSTAVRQDLAGHNDRYAKRMVAEHSRLLIEELKADEAQRTAIVRDDVRNLVIAGAGSGKTRTIIGRIRFLLERHVPPTAVLAVTFTNKATEEMQDRLKQMGVSIADRERGGVTVSTLHSLGKRVVQAIATGPISIADDRWTDSLVAAVLREARTGQDPRLAQLYVNAVLNFHRNEDESTLAVGGDKTYRTLRGEHVRSVGERIIADFLFFNHVEYKYEARASWASVGKERGAYHPDFTLPESGASIEYWGVNRVGEVPAGWTTSTAEYKQGMAWKRDLFRREGKTLIEFYDYERTERTLESALRERLAAAGIALRPMKFEEIGKSFGDLKYIGSSVEKLLVQFITNARAMRREPKEIQPHLQGTTPRVHHFGLLGIAVLERYQAALSAEGRIDFSDMLHRAADILETGTNPLPKFEHVLVDEFQDTSAAMARLMKALVAVTRARLFAVGDDWQAIYGFAGGDVDHIINFESHFGPASTTMLNVNYRSPAVIVEAGAALIARNERQVPKQVVIFSREQGEAYVHEVSDDDSAIVDRTASLVREELRQVPADRILVLSRTNHLLEDVIEACRRNGVPVGNPDRDVQGVRILSAHKAKGLEADVVIVANASDHLFGFPSKVENPDVLEPVRMSAGDAQAEERRLFYVAITRAMKRLHLVSRQGLPSPYLAEIEGGVNLPKAPDPANIRVGARFAGAFSVERLYGLSDRQKAAGIRQSGLLATSTSRMAFTSWATFTLEEGALYWLNDVVKDQPYRDQQRVKLDERTSGNLQLRSPVDRQNGGRELRPRPPPSHQPRLLQR
jgi:DNA helicase-4